MKSVGAVMTFIETIIATSKRIRDGRGRLNVLAKAGEEFGELSQEVLIAQGDHYKKPGKDGVIGEAIDLMICCTDLIFGENPDITEDELKVILEKKLAKWLEKAQIQNPGCVQTPFSVEPFYSDLKFDEHHSTPLMAGFLREDGEIVFMDTADFHKVLYQMVNGRLKGRFIVVPDADWYTIKLSHVVFGDIDEARRDDFIEVPEV